MRHPNPAPRLVRWLRQLVPPVCWLCRKVLGADTFLDPASPFLCSSCLDELPWSDWERRCGRCGHSVDGFSRGNCTRCLEMGWDLDQTRSAFSYSGTVREWVLDFKFHGRDHLALMLGRLLALSLQGDDWISRHELMIPIPLHPSRLRTRGFNQSVLLAHQLRKNLPKPRPLLQPGALRRIRPTTPQTELSFHERLSNPEGAFALTGSLRNRRVLLIDDVMTTGSTLNSTARVLFEAGARSVSALVLCQTEFDEGSIPVNY